MFTANSFRTSHAAKRRWQSYPDIDSMLLTAYAQMEQFAKREMTLNASFIQDINHAALSYSGSRYPIRTLSSILNKLQADHCDFIKYLESQFKISEGYDFLSARIEVDYLDGLEAYGHAFACMPIEELTSLMRISQDSDLSKNSVNSIQKNIRVRSLFSHDYEQLKSDIFYAMKNFPEIFSALNKHEVINNPAIKDVAVDLIMNRDLEIDEDCSKFCQNVLEYFSDTIAGFFVDKINLMHGMSEEEKANLLVSVFKDRLLISAEPIVDYVHHVIMSKPEKLDSSRLWVQDLACELLLTKNKAWAYYNIGEAAIVYNSAENDFDAIIAFLNALDRESILNPSEVEGVIDESGADRKNISMVYAKAFTQIFDFAHHRPLYSISNDTQNRLLQFSIATGTEREMFNAYVQSFEASMTKAKNNDQRTKIKGMMEGARENFNIPLEQLSPTNRRIILEMEIAF